MMCTNLMNSVFFHFSQKKVIHNMKMLENTMYEKVSGSRKRYILTYKISRMVE